MARNMGVNHPMDLTISDDDDDKMYIPRNRPLEYSEWVTWYSNDLLNMWMSLIAYNEDSSNTSYILDQGSFEKFSEFCYTYSCKSRSLYPS